MNKNQDVTFDNGAAGFLTGLADNCGDDLIYSFALESGNLFMCVTAHPSMTKKTFKSGNLREVFLIEPNELDISQEDMIKTLSGLINGSLGDHDEA